jgi:methyl-accepting chemotaxis protein
LRLSGEAQAAGAEALAAEAERAKLADRQRDTLLAQERRRSEVDAEIGVFRERIHLVTRTVGESSNVLKATASQLFDSANATSRRVEEAMETSSEGARNVETAAARSRRAVALDRRDQPRAGADRRGGRRRHQGGREHEQADRRAGRGRRKDRRRDGADPRHRRADQPAGAQRDHRGRRAPAKPEGVSRWSPRR